MELTLDDRFLLAGTVVDSRYAVDRPIARGGFGLVYRAEHVTLKTPIALKVLVVPEHLRGATDSLVERFRLEARTLATLAHPSVVRVFDVGQLEVGDEPCVWMALEWLDGETLDAHLSESPGGLSPREALALLAPVIDAVACAHDRGIAHRDLKPANVMVTVDANGVSVSRVLDFGIAKEMAPDEGPGTGYTETRSDHAAFSLPYAAPEQVGRIRTGPWTDVHALGLLLVEALVGHAAYDGTDSFALYASIMATQRPTPSQFGVRVGPWEPVLARALALHPGERYADARALGDALTASVDLAQRAWERALAPSRPPPVSPPRRHRALSALALSALALSALALPRSSVPAPPRPGVASPARSPAAAIRHPASRPAPLRPVAMAPVPQTEAPPRPALRRPAARALDQPAAVSRSRLSARSPDDIVME